MLQHLRPALVLLLAMTVLTGLAYPYGVTGAARLLFPDQASGSLVGLNGRIAGSELIGQNFTAEKYFHGRPSATAMPYDAGASSGSNLGPTSKALLDRVKGDAGRLAVENPSMPVPVDLVTASASGLDPDITPAGALFQVPRVAKARGLAEEDVRRLVNDHIEGRLLGVIGELHVNVLKLNLALDAMRKG